MNLFSVKLNLTFTLAESSLFYVSCQQNYIQVKGNNYKFFRKSKYRACPGYGYTLKSLDWQHFRIPTSNLIHLQQESTFTFPKGWKFSKARHVKVFGEICISAYIYLDICIHFVFYSCLLDLLQLPNHLLVLLTRAFTVIHSDFVIGWLNRGDMGILLMEFEPLYKSLKNTEYNALKNTGLVVCSQIFIYINVHTSVASLLNRPHWYRSLSFQSSSFSKASLAFSLSSLGITASDPSKLAKI